mmetsp:Transcript_44888/g.137091  ORF Transcript_44888/g.137091 Transcript_44888/m.137091 type:complete len:220 (-) Transcript_44888:855-1514(-)
MCPSLLANAVKIGGSKLTRTTSSKGCSCARNMFSHGAFSSQSFRNGSNSVNFSTSPRLVTNATIRVQNKHSSAVSANATRRPICCALCVSPTLPQKMSFGRGAADTCMVNGAGWCSICTAEARAFSVEKDTNPASRTVPSSPPNTSFEAAITPLVAKPVAPSTLLKAVFVVMLAIPVVMLAIPLTARSGVFKLPPLSLVFDLLSSSIKSPSHGCSKMAS